MKLVVRNSLLLKEHNYSREISGILDSLKAFEEVLGLDVFLASVQDGEGRKWGRGRMHKDQVELPER